MSGPLVSVVIPVFNGARFLGPTLASVSAQTFPDLEVIVVDDGSSDGSGEIAVAAGAMVIRQENRGVSAARNAALQKVRGEFIAFLDADDLWHPEKIERQLSLTSTIEGPVVCSSRFCYFLSPGIPAPHLFEPGIHGVPNDKACPSTWLVHRDVFTQAGTFREDYEVAEDIEWIARVRDLQISTPAVHTCLVSKRIHDRNLSGRLHDPHRAAISALRASVARKRALEEGRE